MLITRLRRMIAMPHPVVLDELNAEQRAHFKSLTQAPKLSLPILALWIVVVGSYVLSWTGGLMGWMPLWLGCAINSVVGYYAFSIVHDSIHRAISSNTRINDWMGQSAAILGAPYLSLPLFRWTHILHHRFANSPRDPDWMLHGPAWSLPLRWMFIDVLYFVYTVKYLDKISKKHLIASVPLAVATAAVFSTLIYTGHGLQLIMLWLIPSRVLFTTLGFAFFWLPHAPHDTTQADNFTKASTLRLGYEALLTPLLQYQNYHLIHHLWPTTPFYNNRRVWLLVEPILRQHDLSIQHNFSVYPQRETSA